MHHISSQTCTRKTPRNCKCAGANKPEKYPDIFAPIMVPVALILLVTPFLLLAITGPSLGIPEPKLWVITLTAPDHVVADTWEITSRWEPIIITTDIGQNISGQSNITALPGWRLSVKPAPEAVE